MTEFFFELIRVAIGNQKELSRSLSASEWDELYNICLKQTLLGVGFAGVLRMEAAGDTKGITDELKRRWYFDAATIQEDNDAANQRCDRTLNAIRKSGFEACILKGQGVAKSYPDDEEVELSCLRQTGDIDVWMWPKGDWSLSHDERVLKVLSFAHRHGAKQELCYHHVDMNPAKGYSIEAHFTPSWMSSPYADRKLQTWFREHAPQEMTNDFTSLSFNLVYLLIHIYRHLFREGIGLRQVLDYYFVLKKSNLENVDKRKALEVLKDLGLSRFTTALMWILESQFGMKQDELLCKSNPDEGRFLLDEIMRTGNFGIYDPNRNKEAKDGSLSKFFVQIKRNLHFLTHYPSEVFWSPLWSIWHQMWIRRIRRQSTSN